MSNTEKAAALAAAISSYTRPINVGKSKFRVGQKLIHIRFCSAQSPESTKFKFNINPNTLSADYELWVCGSASNYYLMPVDLMRTTYEDPNTYVDRTHPNLRVVSVDSESNTVMYARGGRSISLVPYLNAKLT